MSIINLIFGVVGIIVGWFLNNFFPSYFKEKGKNLATKEDISEITNTMERIKTDYVKEIEELKAEFQVYIGVRAKKEEAYAKLIYKLYDFFIYLKQFGYEVEDNLNVGKFGPLSLEKTSELEEEVYANSLYLDSDIIEDILSLRWKYSNLIAKALLDNNLEIKNKINLYEEGLEELWKYVKEDIISRMKEELGFRKHVVDKVNLYMEKKYEYNFSEN